MAYYQTPNYIPHAADFDPAAYPTYPAQPFPQHPQQQHQQPPPYPLSYPVNTLPYTQPHQTPEGQVHRSHHYASQQHQQQYQLPNQAHGHGPPASGSMPPPSSIPDSSFHRQNYAYASAPRTPDRWPLGLTEDQRHLQEQYRQQSQTPQIPPSYHQPSPMISAAPTGPVSTFPPPPNKTRSPPQIKAPPQTPQAIPSPPSTAQQSQKPMPTTAAKSNPQSISGSPPESGKPVLASTDPTSLESQRVSALLDLNRVLLFEVVALQKVNKTGPSPAPPQRNPQQTSPPPATDGAPATAPSQTPPDATPAAKHDNDNPTASTTENSKDPPTTNNEAQPQPQTTTSNPQNTTTNPTNKIPASKEYIEYMRRLQANLAYLASVADRHHKPGNAVPQYPAIMEAPNLPPPPSTTKDTETEAKEEKEDLREIYHRLRELWPEYKGKAGTPGPGAGTTVA
ncbi:MAG: hypothetical protein Q9218_007001 [Villophora microphyllina]